MNPFRRLIGGRHPRARLPEQPPGEVRIPILAITSDGQDRRLLSQFAASAKWDLSIAGSMEDAPPILKHSEPAVILCARDLISVDWREAFRQLALLKPECALILISPTYDDGLWDEVVQKGGYDLLKTPLREDQTISAVNLAWLYSRSARRPAPL